MKACWFAMLCALAFAGCASNDDTSSSKVGELEARVAELEEALAEAATTTSTTAEEEEPPNAEAPPACEPWQEEAVDAQLSHACAVSCPTALAFAGLGTNPGLNDVFGYDVAYFRIIDLAGNEQPVGAEVTAGTTAVEMLAVYSVRSDPNVFERSAYYHRWAPTGTAPSEADVIDDAYWLEEGPQVGGSDEDEARGFVVDHRLQDTAQFLDTPVGCFPNPHRAADAGGSVSPPVESTTDAGTADEDSAEMAVGRWVDEEIGVTYVGPCTEDLEPGSGLCSVHLGGRGADRVVLALGEPASEYYIWLLVEKQGSSWSVVQEYIPEDSYDLSDAPEWVEG